MIQSFLISLEAAPDRRAKSQAVLEAAGVPFTRIEAVDGRALEPRDVAGFGRQISGAEQGCRASHDAALRAFLATGAEVGLIVEDDIAGADADALGAVAAWLAGREGWDVAHLSAADFGFRSYWGVVDGVQIQRAHLFPMTTPALLWSRAGAEAFLDAALDWPMDHALRDWTLRRRSGLGLDRVVVEVGPATSLITDRDALLTPGYQVRRARRRRKDRARAAWNRLRWQMFSRWHF